MATLLKIGALLGIVAVVSSVAGSSAIAETPEERAACINDAFRFCLSAIPDRGEVFSCLVAHSSLISEPCRTLVTSNISASQIAAKKSPETVANTSQSPR
jgi:hypothetical protein